MAQAKNTRGRNKSARRKKAKRRSTVQEVQLKIIQTVKNLHREGMSVEEIADLIVLDSNTVEKILA